MYREILTCQSHTIKVFSWYHHLITIVTSVKSSIGILTHQGHISKVNANDEY